MSSTTSNLALYKPTVGGDTDAWGTQLNSNMDTLDNAVLLTNTQTLTNKTIDAASNTLTNVSLTTAVTGTLPVANGGTGGTSHTANNVLLGNGTGALLKVAPGTSGNVLTSNGTTWTSTAPSGGGGSGTVTSVAVSGGTTGLTTSGGPITTTGTITLAGTLAVANGGTGATSLASAGITTLTGTQTLSGNKTFSGTTTLSGTTNVTGIANFTTASNGSAFGRTSANNNFALWCQPASTSAGYAGIVTQSYGGNNGLTCASTATGTALVAFYYGDYSAPTAIGNIASNGSTTTYNTTSDYRLKENINSLENAVTRLKQLAPKNFTWKNNPSLGSVEGFIAHELQAVVPGAVTGEKDAVDEQGNPKYQGIDTSMLIPLLTSALQEAFARIEALEAQA